MDNGQFAIRNSQFAIRNSQSAICNPQSAICDRQCNRQYNRQFAKCNWPVVAKQSSTVSISVLPNFAHSHRLILAPRSDTYTYLSTLPALPTPSLSPAVLRSLLGSCEIITTLVCKSQLLRWSSPGGSRWLGSASTFHERIDVTEQTVSQGSRFQ